MRVANNSRPSHQPLSDLDSVRSIFNEVAETIDLVPIRNPINSWMRNVSRRAILETFPPGSNLFEIGCGSGADAVHLAEHGFRVAALDISDLMVKLTNERTVAHNCAARVVAVRGRITDLVEDLMRLAWFPFDGAYANFSLAYEDSLRKVMEAAYLLLKPGAWFVFSLPNKLCVSHVVSALSRLHVSNAFNRLREPYWTEMRGQPIRVRLYTPGGMSRIVKGLFEVRAYVGVPVFMPPSSLYDPTFEGLRRSLEHLDNRLSDRFPWRLLGESTLFKAQRVAE